jgi:predicted dehydrogenase
MSKTIGIAMIGVGAISGIYLENITKVFKEIKLVGVCDLIRERAENAQKKYNVPKLYETMHDAFADPEVDLVLNITRPYEHFEVSKAALLAGKHVYCEKPLGATFEEGVELVRLAQEKGLYLGGAPDTFMGAGIQTARKVIDEGAIGTPIGAVAAMTCHGHESWHPDPEFYYKFGGGPMLDMGPYYITALVNLMGGVSEVSGVAKKSFPTRTITSQPHYGEVVDVDVDTYVTGTLMFDNGAVGTIFTTFDIYGGDGCRIDIYGTEGTLSVPDPNGFGGPVKLLKDGKWTEIAIGGFDYEQNSRALGLADMAKSIADGRKARCDYTQTEHVLEIMTMIGKSSDEGKRIKLTTHYDRGIPMVKPEVKGILD